MSTFVTDRERITKAVLKELLPEYTESDFEASLFKWWKNPRTNGGLGLTVAGAQAFDDAGLESDTHPLRNDDAPPGSWTHDVLRLSRHITCPYLIEYSKGRIQVRVYDSRVSMMIYLQGDVESYLNNLKE